MCWRGPKVGSRKPSVSPCSRAASMNSCWLPVSRPSATSTSRSGPARARGEAGQRVVFGEALAVAGDEALGEAEGGHLAAPRIGARGARIAQRGEALRAEEGARDREDRALILGCGDLADGLAVVHGVRRTSPEGMRSAACLHWMSSTRMTCKRVGMLAGKGPYMNTASGPLALRSTYLYVVSMDVVHMGDMHSDD